MPGTYNVVPTVATGDWITAGWVNTYIGGNMVAMWAGLVAGDMDYYTSATQKGRVPIGSPGQMMYTNAAGTAPVWGTGKRVLPVYLNSDVALAVGDYLGWFMVTPEFNGWKISAVYAMRKAGGTGVPEFQLRNVTDGVDILSTKLTIDSGETHSGSAAVPAVINTSVNDFASYDLFAVDVDAGGTNTFDAVVYVAFGQT